MQRKQKILVFFQILKVFKKKKKSVFVVVKPWQAAKHHTVTHSSLHCGIGRESEGQSEKTHGLK